MSGPKRAQGSNQILAVSWAMPPLLAPRAIQVPRTLKALVSLGWAPTVLCAATALMDKNLLHDDQLKELPGGGYKSIVVKPPFLCRPLHTASGYTLLRMAGLADAAWQRWTTRTALGLMKIERFQALITFAQPWSDHLVGLDLRRRTGIPWIAHFSDPWVTALTSTKTTGDFLCGDRRKRPLPRANAIIFTNEHTADLVTRKYPGEFREKSHVVPHGYDAGLARIVAPAKKGVRLRMVSIGSFYRARTPMPLLQALAELNRAEPLANSLEVILSGENNLPYMESVTSLGLAESVRCQDSVPFLESQRLAASADVLLVIDAPSDGASVFLPSKLVDYLMFEKPILGITPPEGSSADLLRRGDCSVVPPGDIQGIAAAVKALLEDWRAGRLGVSGRFREMARGYEVTETTRVLDAIIRQIGRR